ncbi:MAG TPA: crossover junction endodeoxyribonuclease RuvC [Candidatus Faecicola pullistercoris]|nr:crossover junction endodeoxyribonuclease RuvC [Candidatus Faecicola pullistercoris]
MVILGIDPGLATVGYGVIEVQSAYSLKVLDVGVIETPKEESTPVRLAMIENCMQQLIDRYKPDEVAIEELFFTKNITTGIAVAEARGVILLTAIKACGRLYEYTPMQIKQAITGWGGADKRQVQQMVKTLLGLSKVPRPDDAADALAVAYTHSQANRMANLFSI